ncbi:hypothetical protein MKW92_024594 [Papaver armeniacum]|nr:hypothetical protein MKW92_024594 [Papaver armeniacum]
MAFVRNSTSLLTSTFTSRNPFFLFASLSPTFSQIHRQKHNKLTCKSKPTRRKSRQKSPTEKDMSVSLQIPPSEEGASLLGSRTSSRSHLPSSEKGEVLMTDKEGETCSSSKASGRKMKPYISFFGVDLSPDNIAVSMVYFVQGVLGLSRLAVSFYLKDDLHLDPAETAVVTGVSALPWLIKPLYGFISDSVPLFGYRRRSYLVLSGLLGALSWSLMASLVDDKYGAAFCILLGSLSVAFSDVVVDSMVVERARGESQSTSGSLQSLCWGSSAFGGIVSAYFSGSLVDAYGVRFVFGITALLPLITSAVAVLVKEKPSSRSTGGHNLSLVGAGFFESSKQNIIQLLGAIRQPNIFLPTLFIFLWQATPHSESAMFYFTTNKLGFTPNFLVVSSLSLRFASLLGVGLYNGFLKNVPCERFFFRVFGQVILVTGLNRQFGIIHACFSVGCKIMSRWYGSNTICNPHVHLKWRECHRGLLGAGLTQLLGVTRDSFNNLTFLIVICNLSSLLPLPLLGLLPKDIPDTKPSQRMEMSR